MLFVGFKKINWEIFGLVVLGQVFVNMTANHLLISLKNKG